MYSIECLNQVSKIEKPYWSMWMAVEMTAVRTEFAIAGGVPGGDMCVGTGSGEVVAP